MMQAKITIQKLINAIARGLDKLHFFIYVYPFLNLALILLR